MNMELTKNDDDDTKMDGDTKSRNGVESQRHPVAQVVLRTITGLCHSANRRAIDWSSNGLVAFASHGVIVVADPVSLQQVQGEVKSRLSDGSRPVPELLWMDGSVGENNGHLLLALHLPSTLIMWDTGSGQQVWKKTFSETLRGFDLDPFDDSRVLLRCNDCILFLSDFSTSKCPSGNSKKFYISGPSKGSPARDNGDHSSTAATPTVEDRTKATRSKIKKMMKEFVMGEVSNELTSSTGFNALDTLSECQQVLFHRSARSHLLIAYQREVLILDMDIGQTVGIITSVVSPIVHVWSSSQRDAIFLLYDNGVVSMRCRKRLYAVANTPALVEPENVNQDPVMEINYEQRGQSEMIRLSKNAKILGFAIHPITERNISVLASDGRLIFVDVVANTNADTNDVSKMTLRKMNAEIIRPIYCLDDLLTSSFESVDPPNVKLSTSGILSGLVLPPFVLRMCPPLTLKNWNQYVPLCAVGASSGSVQIVNMATGSVDREFALHTFPVRGIEWTGLNSILSHAHQNLSGNSASLVRNELVHTDIKTGKNVSLRATGLEEPPIQMIRVSHLKQYFIVAFVGAPFELWDLKNLHPLRTMPRKFPPITALEWSPLHNLKSLKRKMREEREKQVSSPTEEHPEIKEEFPIDDSHLTAKEHFVFTDPVGQLYHFSVEGNAIRDGTKLPAEASLSSITCISWKSDHIVRGDSEGNLNVWDVRTRTSRHINTNRGPIKKIRFAPGRGNMKLLVLHNDSVAIWDAKECEIINELRTSKDLVSKPTEIEWAASDRPIVVTADGCLKIMSLALTSSTSSISEYERDEAVVCHSLLSNKCRNNFQILIHHQPWKEKFSLEFDESDGFSEQELEIVKQQVDAFPDDTGKYLTNSKVSAARRSLLAAQICGLVWESQFWRLAVSVLEDDSSFFDISFDLLCERDLYVRYELERLRLQESKCSGQYSQRRRVIDLMLCLGLRDEAMTLLLETEPSNPSYYSDHLLACLVASTSAAESGTPHSTTKLVATNLIAEGKLWQGVQLLCLINKVKEACQYLQSYGHWDASLWLAKCHFTGRESDDGLAKVAAKYCEHHFNKDRKKRAILLSLRDYVSVIDKLLNSKMIVLAAQFLEVLKESGKMPDTSHAFVLTEEISLAYARHLFDCGNREAAFYFCDRADEKGEILQRELEMMTSST